MQYHTLGLDLAGSLTATGAVGAVLSSTTYNLPLALGEGNGEGVMSQHYFYDGNGNIISTCDQHGEIIAKLAYSPFGEQLSGPDLPFTFSTKAVDSSGLSYYGFRFYSPEVGRWLTRDPIEEKGGVNVYAMANNNAMNIIDELGLISINPTTNGNQIYIVIDTSGAGEGCEVNVMQLIYRGGKWRPDIGIGTDVPPYPPFYFDKNSSNYANFMKQFIDDYNKKNGTNYSYPTNMIFFDSPANQFYFIVAVVERCCIEYMECYCAPKVCKRSKIKVVASLQWNNKDRIAKIENYVDESQMKTIINQNLQEIFHVCPSEDDPYRYIKEEVTIE